jgi:molybdenum cofactor synthesis domain-containing protein
MNPHPFIAILTVSDSAAAGQAEDRSGPLLRELVRTLWPEQEPIMGIVADDRALIAARLRGWADEQDVALILTSGGTGFTPRDVTPEATRDVIEKEAPGLAEAMRLVNPLGRLSRGVAGTVGTALVLNTPGSSSGCVECLEAVIDVVPHAVRLLVDNADPHPGH